MDQNVFNPEKYKWRGFNPRVTRSYMGFKWKPWVNKGANFREVHFLWWCLSLSWWWNHHVIWNDGYDAHFRQTLHREAIIESTKISNRNN
jgi:hypothetical protein